MIDEEDGKPNLAVDSQKAIRFFVESLLGMKREDLPKDAMVTEVKYVASILAHYSQVSCAYSGIDHMPLETDLTGIFDNFVISNFRPDSPVYMTTDSKILETAGSQALVFAGFFQDQMRKRHSIKYFNEVGRSFLSRASVNLPDHQKKKKVVLNFVAKRFPEWTNSCCLLARNLRWNRYLLNLDQKAS